MLRPVFSIILFVGLGLAACSPETNSGNEPSIDMTQIVDETTSGSEQAVDSAPVSSVTHPDWSVNAAIYQINTRQFTPEGTFAAAAEELPRLADMGIDIVWLMPIHPIGEVNRKGTLGSPYAVQDYFAVNPEFGTEEDFRAFIARAHDLDMKVILDWVANHSAWDHVAITETPDWYTTNEAGEIIHPVDTDWTDVADFNYDNTDLRDHMSAALSYWVEEFDIDGYRCDVSYMVPMDFWERVRAELDAIKPVFMLAEADQPDQHQAFDATYAWSWKDTIHPIAMGEMTVDDLRAYYDGQDSDFPSDAMRLTYIENHDQNAWDANMFDFHADNLRNAIVLSVVGEGIPMMYNGQEVGNADMLEFFEKDPIIWGETHWVGDLFISLFALLEVNTALWHGDAGGQMVEITTGNPDNIYAFERSNGDDSVVAIFNISDQNQSAVLEGLAEPNGYSDFDSGLNADLDDGTALDLEPWSHVLFVKGALPE